MKKYNYFQKFNLFLVISTFIIWFGTYIARHLAVYQLFEPEGLVLRSIYTKDNLNVIFEIIFPLLVTPLVTFPIFIILLLLYLFTSRINLKKEGWLFISLLIIIITAPFEIFLLIKDYKIINLILSQNYDSMEILDNIRNRITVLSSFSLIEIFSYLAIVFLTIFKPLSKSDEIKREGT